MGGIILSIKQFLFLEKTGMEQNTNKKQFVND